jgi:hypothetical protein
MSGNKLYRLAIATALALPSLGAQAIVFGPGLNDIELINRENNYRTTDNCTAFGGCLAATADDPAGFQRVDPTITSALPRTIVLRMEETARATISLASSLPAP